MIEKSRSQNKFVTALICVPRLSVRLWVLSVRLSADAYFSLTQSERRIITKTEQRKKKTTENVVVVFAAEDNINKNVFSLNCSGAEDDNKPKSWSFCCCWFLSGLVFLTWSEFGAFSMFLFLFPSWSDASNWVIKCLFYSETWKREKLIIYLFTKQYDDICHNCVHANDNERERGQMYVLGMWH